MLRTEGTEVRGHAHTHNVRTRCGEECAVCVCAEDVEDKLEENLFALLSVPSSCLLPFGVGPRARTEPGRGVIRYSEEWRGDQD